MLSFKNLYDGTMIKGVEPHNVNLANILKGFKLSHDHDLLTDQ
ncbi:hypothetical protein VIAG107301_02120 [Vibrio agarivorans]